MTMSRSRSELAIRPDVFHQILPIESNMLLRVTHAKVVTLLNLLSFGFKMLFLPNYRVKYYDYIVTLCSGIVWNWCVSLDIALILAVCWRTNQSKLSFFCKTGDPIQTWLIMPGSNRQAMF